MVDLLSDSIENMQNQWLDFFDGNRNLIPDSVDRVIDLKDELLECLNALEFEAEGTLNQDDIVIISSDSEMEDENVYEECMICLDNIDGKTPVSRFKPCSHLIHTSCWDNFKRRTPALHCPKCKTLLEKGRSNNDDRIVNVSQRSASPLSKLSFGSGHSQVRHVIEEAERNEESPLKVLQNVVRERERVKKNLCHPISGASGHDSGRNVGRATMYRNTRDEDTVAENMKCLGLTHVYTLYKQLNRWVFQGKLPENPSFSRKGKYIKIEGNGLEMHIPRVSSMKSKAVLLLKKMKKESDKFGVMRLDEPLIKKIKKMFNENEYNVEMCVKETGGKGGKGGKQNRKKSATTRL